MPRKRPSTDPLAAKAPTERESYGPKPVSDNLFTSKIHENSSAALSSELEIFQIPLTNLSIEKTRQMEYFPLSAMQPLETTWEFRVPGDQLFVDLNSIYLHVRFKVERADGEPWKTAPLTKTSTVDGKTVSETFPVDDIRIDSTPIPSLFSNVDLYCNSVRLTDQNGTFPFNSKINEIFYTSSEARRTHRLAAGYTKANNGELKVGSKSFDFIDKLCLPLMACDKALLSHVTLFFRFLKSRDSFIVHNESTPPQSQEFVVKIEKIVLKLKK